MHLLAGLSFGREATCGKKINYRSEESACDAAGRMMTKGSKELEAYPCAWCGGWHIGRAMTTEERRTWAAVAADT